MCDVMCFEQQARPIHDPMQQSHDAVDTELLRFIMLHVARYNSLTCVANDL